MKDRGGGNDGNVIAPAENLEVPQKYIMVVPTKGERGRRAVPIHTGNMSTAKILEIGAKSYPTLHSSSLLCMLPSQSLSAPKV